MASWEVRLTWLDCNQRSYIWIFGWTLREDVRLACAQTPEQFFDLHVPFQLSAKEQKIIYANVYRNTINDGDSQTFPLPIFPEGGGTSVHRLHFFVSIFFGLIGKVMHAKREFCTTITLFSWSVLVLTIALNQSAHKKSLNYYIQCFIPRKVLFNLRITMTSAL